eukprot:Hpha_TRINITY_DN11448_c0_g1::TRINITY_DN11448_c0_g1_i1::g.137315::m.137315
MMKVFVQFPQHPVAVRLQCDGSYNDFRRVIASHKLAVRPVGTLSHQLRLPDGQVIQVEVEEDSFGEVSEELIHVHWFSADDSPEKSDPAENASQTPQPRSAQRVPAAASTGGQAAAAAVPRLNLSDLVHPPEFASPPQVAGKGAPVLDAEDAIRRLEHSSGRIEAVKVPQFLRSISVDFVTDDLWRRMASCKMSTDGFISHRDLGRITDHFAGAQKATFRPPLATSPHPLPGGGRASGRPSPFVPTPRTCITPRDILPLGASAVSPMPGRTLAEILEQYDSRPSSRSGSQGSRPASLRGRRPARDESGGRRAHSEGARSAASLRTVADAAEQWPSYRGSARSPGPAAREAGGAARPSVRHSERNRSPDRAVQEVCHTALRVFQGKDGARLRVSDMPTLCAVAQLPCGSASLNRILSELQLPRYGTLGRRELALALSRMARLPPDQAVAQVMETLEVYLQESSRSDEHDGHGESADELDALFALAGGSRRKKQSESSRARDPIGSRTSASSLSSQAMPCPTCGSTLGRAPSVCGSCRFASYCCTDCQVADWPKHQPICDTITQHILSEHRPVRVLARHKGSPFHVQVCMSDARMMSSPPDAPPPPQGSQYLFIVSQRAPVLRNVFIMLSSVYGPCEFSYPHMPPGVTEAQAHLLLLDVFTAAFEVAITQRIWSLAGCCLGPMRGYYFETGDYTGLIRRLGEYYSTFLCEELQTIATCDSEVVYELIVQPLEALSESYEALVLSPSRGRNTKDAGFLTQSKDAYLQLISFLKETRFVGGLVERAAKDRAAALRRLAVVYQHLAARERGNRALNYLKQGEQVMKDLIAQEPSVESYGLLALLYESLPNDPTYKSRAHAVREKIDELRSGGRRAERRADRSSAAGSSTLHRPPRGVEGAAALNKGASPTPPRPTAPVGVGSAASPAEETLPRCAVCHRRVTDPQRKDWDRASRAMLYFCSDEHLQARRRAAVTPGRPA